MKTTTNDENVEAESDEFNHTDEDIFGGRVHIG
jgi:hypothetical protein